MMHVTHTVYCDIKGPDCMEHNNEDVGSRTRSDARRDARRGGFKRVRQDGALIDVCPNCIENVKQAVPK